MSTEVENNVQADQSSLPVLDDDILEFAHLMQIKRNEMFIGEGEGHYSQLGNKELMEMLVTAFIDSDDEDQLITVAMLSMLIHNNEGPRPGQLIQADGEEATLSPHMETIVDIGED